MPKTHRNLNDRIARQIVDTLREGPATSERLRELVTGSNARIDQVLRMLVAGGRVEHLDRRRGWTLVEGDGARLNTVQTGDGER